MADVMLSIRPKWCELIANGKKTIEVRKTRPKLETPFKCYIYQTLPKSGDWNERDGRVIGEFVCDWITEYRFPYDYNENRVVFSLRVLANLAPKDALKYGGGKTLFGWHISDLVVYEKPKKLHEFNGICSKKALKDCKCETCERLLKSGIGHCPMEYLKRPPQSWCYVEEA